LIERNRILLVVKLFPWSLLWLNGAYYLARLAAGAWAAARGKGEVRRYPGTGGKLKIAWALMRGDFQALRLIPKMLGKRRQIGRFRKLSPSQVRSLILSHRIPLKTLSEDAI
jgi:hypothetical protein